MNLLAFDTSTEVLSIAVQWQEHGVARTTSHEGPGGAAASSTLLPAIQTLLADAALRVQDLDAIVFGCGPGSFTGLRTACSVAQGLAFGASRRVLPVGTLLAVAEAARSLCGATRVVTALDARMGEVYFASYEFQQGLWRELQEPRLGQPEQVPVPPGWELAGNAHLAYPGRLSGGEGAQRALPTAAALLSVAPALISAGGLRDPRDALPLYIRDKVAQTTQERDAQRTANIPR